MQQDRIKVYGGLNGGNSSKSKDGPRKKITMDEYLKSIGHTTTEEIVEERNKLHNEAVSELIERDNNKLEARNKELANELSEKDTKDRAAENKAKKNKTKKLSWDWSPAKKAYDDKLSKLHSLIESGLNLLGRLDLIKADHTVVPIQTKDGIKYTTPYKARQEELNYIDDRANLEYDHKIIPIESALLTVRSQRQALRDLKGGYSAVGGAMNNKSASDLKLKEEYLLNQLSLLQEEKELYRQQLKDEIDPNAKTASTFMTFWANEDFNPGLAQKRRNVQAAHDLYDLLYRLKQSELDLADIFSKRLVEDKYRGALAKAASKEFEAQRVFDREMNDYRILDQWIRLNGWPRNPANLPGYIRNIAERALPGSTSQNGTTLLINSQYLGDHTQIADRILRRMQNKDDVGGGAIDVTEDLVLDAINEMEHRKHLAESIANDEESTKRFGKTSQLLGADLQYKMNVDKADPNYDLYDKALGVLNRAKSDMHLNERAKKGAWNSVNPFENTILIGAYRAVSKKNFWDLGLSDLDDALTNKRISDKIDSGQLLSKGELAYLNALAINEIVQSNHTDALTLGGALAGDVAANSAMFVAQFVASKGILSGIASSAEKAASKSISKKIALFMLGRTGDRMMRKATLEGVKKYGGHLLEAKMLMAAAKTPGFLTKVAGDLTYSIALANTLLGAKTTSDIMNLHTGNVAYQLDDNGKIIGTGFESGVDWDKAIYTAETRQSIENFSEMMGEWGIGTLLGKMAKFAGRKALPPMIKLMGRHNYAAMLEKGHSQIVKSRWFLHNAAPYKLRKYASDIIGGNNSKFKEFMKSGQYHGFVGEMSEEYYGMALLHMMGVSDSDNSFWDDLTSKQQFFDIFGGIALSSAVMGIGSQLHYAHYAKRFYDAEKKAKETFGSHWSDIERAIIFAEDLNLGSVMSRLTSIAKSPKEKEVLLNYFHRLMGYRGVSELLLNLARERNRTSHQLSIEDSLTSGYLTATQSARNDLQRAIDASDQHLSLQYGAERYGASSMRDLIEQFGGVEEFINAHNLTAELKNQLYAFDNMIAALDGMTARAIDDFEDMILERSRQVDRLTHRNGNIVEAKDKSGKQIYVVEGKVESDKDGKIDYEKSDKQVKISDSEGNVSLIDTEQLEKIVGKKSANSVKALLTLELYAFEAAFNRRNEQKLGTKIGELHDLGDGRTLTVVGSSRDGGILYSISDGKTETIGHKKNPGEMKQLIDEINQGRIEKIIERAVEQSKDDGQPLDSGPQIDEDEARRILEEKEKERRVETETKPVAAHIPTTTKQGKEKASSTAYKTAKKVANAIEDNTTFEEFRLALEDQGLNFDHKYDGRLLKLFKAAKKGNITAAQLASVFAKQEDRKGLHKNALDEDGINIDDDGNIVKPRKRYVAPKVLDVVSSDQTGIVTLEADEEDFDENIDDDPLNKTWSELLKHLKKVNSEFVGRTGQAYFFRIDGKLVMYLRLHGILPHQYEYKEGETWYPKTMAERNMHGVILQELNEAYDENGIDGVKDYVKNHKKYYPDLDVYFEYLEQSPLDLNTILDYIASDFSRTLYGNSTTYGQLVDILQRRFFNGETIQYEDVVDDPHTPQIHGKALRELMPLETFKDIITGLEALKKTYDSLGWKVSYEPHIFYIELADGRKVAGEIDAVAVNELGDSFVIDTKTSYKEYTQALDETNPLFQREAPEEGIYNRFSGQRRRQVVSQGEAYTQQLTYYAMMINNILKSGQVIGIHLTPWTLDYLGTSSAIWLKGAKNNPLIITLALNQDLMSRFAPMSAANQAEEELRQTKENLQKYFDTVYGAYTDLLDEYKDQLESLPASIQFGLTDLTTRISNVQDTYLNLGSVVDCQMYTNVLASITADIEMVRYQINMHLEDLARMKAEEEAAAAALLNKPAPKTDEEIAGAAAVVQTSTDTYTASTFNTSDGESIGISDAVAEDDPNLKLSSVSGSPDFIDEAEFEFIMKKVRTSRGTVNNKPHVVVTYKGHRFTPIAVRFANSSFYERIKNMCESAGPNERVVPLKIERSPGLIIELDKKDPNKTQSPISAGLISTERGGVGIYIYDITYGESLDVFGVTKEYETPDGKQTLVECPGNILHIYQDKYKQQRAELTGSKGMPAGSIVMMVDRNYLELKRQGLRLRIPVRLQNAKLTEEDAKLILDILSGKHGQLDDLWVESNKKSLGLTNRDIIDLLIPTRVDTESPNVPLHLEIDEQIDPSNGSSVIRSITLVGNVKNIELSDGRTFDISKDYPFMVRPDNQQDMHDLYEILSKYVNRNIDLTTAAMRVGSAHLVQGAYNHPFAKAARAVRSNRRVFENGPVRIGNSSIVFEASDFNDPNTPGDQEGLSGLGWYVKHGFLLTSYNGIENPLLSFDEKAGIEKRQRKEQPVLPVQTPKLTTSNAVEQQKERKRKIEEMLRALGFLKLQDRPAEKPLDKELAKKRLEKIFGENNVPIQFYDQVLAILNEGPVAVGKCTADAILLSQAAELGVEWHEAFHRVVELLLSTKERELVYREFRRSKVGRSDMTDKEVAEGLADGFMYYMQNKPTFKLTWNIKKLFRNIVEWIKFFNSIGSFRLFVLYTLTNNGRFRNAKPSPEAVERAKRIGGWYYTVGTEDFKNIYNVTQLKDLVHSLVYMFLNPDTQEINFADPTSVNNLKIDVDTLRNSKVYKTWLEEIPENNPTHKLLVEAVEKYDALQPLVLAALREFITDYSQREQDEDAQKAGEDTENKTGEETTSEEDAESASIGEHTKASWETSLFSRATDMVKFLFAGIDSGTRNSLGLPEVYPVRYVFNSVLNEVHDCKSVEDLVKRLADLGRDMPLFYEMGVRLLSLYQGAWGSVQNKQLLDADKEGLLTQVWDVMKSHKGSFKLVKNFKKGLRWCQLIESTDLSHVSKRFVRDWSRQFAVGASRYVKLDNFGRLVMKGKIAPKVFKRLYYFLAGRTIDPNVPESMLGLIYAFSDAAKRPNAPKFKVHDLEVDVNTEEGLEIAKDQFVSFLNSMGIVFDREMFDYMLLHKYGSVGTEGMRKMLTSSGTDSVDAFARFINGFYRQKKDLSGQVIGTELNTYVDKKSGKLLLNGEPIYNIFESSGFVKTLANWKYEYEHAHQLLNVLGTGGKKMYVMHENNTVTDRIDELETEEFRTKLMGVRYVWSEGKGSRLLKYVSRKGHKKLEFITHAGLKTDARGDQGVDYDKINSREDYISKLTVLLSGHILLPTMSDKKTYGWIEGCETAGFNWNKTSYTITDILGPSKTWLYDANGDVIIPVSDEVLDQLLEYAETERQSILHTLSNSSRQHKIDNYHSGSTITDSHGNKHKTINGARFTGLLGVYDKDGNYISFNKTLKENGTDGEGNPIYDYVDEWECYQTACKEFFNKSDAEKRQMLTKLIQMLTRRELEDVEKLGLITRTNVASNDPMRIYENVGLDNTKVQTIYNIIVSSIPANKQSSEALSVAESLAVAFVLQDSVVRYMQSIQEFERVFSGNPSFYKLKWDSKGNLIDRTTDQFKRLGGLVSTGTNNNLSIPGIDPNGEYVCAEVEDEYIQSPQLDKINQLMMSGEIKKVLFNQRTRNLLHFDEGVKPSDKFDFGEGFGEMTVREFEDVVSNMEDSAIEELLLKTEDGKHALSTAKYIAQQKIDRFKKDDNNEGIDVNDGASYISDTMCENLLRMVGSYNKDVQRAFKILRGEKVDGKVYTIKDTVELADAYNLVVTTVIGIQKYTAYGFRFLDGLAVPYYNKMALFPIFKNISTGGMANIYDIMKRQGIDMLMIKSAVKVGGQEAKKNNWESFKDKNFTFNTYKLKYSYIRKQFNTDPKEKDLMSMGTQMTKVAMSLLLAGRSYTVRGQRMSAEDLRNDIMDCIKGLSNNGEKTLRKRFFNEDGTLNVEKFSKILTEELARRGASTRQLDAVKTVIRGDKKQINIPLAAQSAINWILSIIVSMVNKLTVDINTPGEAFYQRSVWGMQGETTVLGDDNLPESINGGKNLLMIIEDGPAKGAMDCVLSIDYFDEILKKATVKTGRKVKKTRKVKKSQYVTYEKYGVTYTDYTKTHDVEVDEEYKDDEYVSVSSLSFKEQRQWLIDHNIIGQNADAIIVSYRIPTQAVSSIHPLRCADVISAAVRHTVILPSEFTKITGSDFDIDKLFMSRLSYNKKGTTEFEENSDEYYGNRLLEDYIAILKDSDWSSAALNGPIDNDTELLTSIVKELYGSQKDELRPFDCYRLGFQSLNRSLFSTGKTGIGPFALNNNNHILTMLYGVRFKEGLKGNILSRLGLLDLSKSEDRDGRSILSWISGLINLHVDVAKDPVIGKLNVNKYTYNLTNLLVRTGLGRTSFYFLTLPIMWLLSEAYANVTGKYMVDQRIPTALRVALAEHLVVVKMINSKMGTSFACDEKSDEYELAINHYKETLEKSISVEKPDDNVQTIDWLIQAIFDKKNERVLANISKNEEHTVDNKSHEIFVTNSEGESEDIKLSTFDIQMLVAIANELFKPYANSLSSLVKYTKIDTKKHGKTLAEQQDYLYNYDRLFNGVEGAGQMFEEAGLRRLKQMSYVETKTTNATNLVIDILGAQMLQGTKTFKNDIRRILDIIGLEPVERNYNAVQKAILAKIKSKFFFGPDGYCEKYGIDAKSLFCGSNSIYDRLINIKADLQSDEKYRNIEGGLVNEKGVITNYMLKTLVTSAVDSNPLDIKEYTPGSLMSTYLGAKFIQVLNYLNDEEIDSDAFTDSWLLLLENDKYPELQQFARDLIVYAFVESCDNGGKFDIFKYVPSEWALGFNEPGFKDSYVKFMSDKLDEYHDADSHGIQELLTEDDIDDIILNNWNDGKFIPTVLAKNYTSWVINNNTGYPAVLAGMVQNNGQFELSIPSISAAPKFIKIARNNQLKGQRHYTIYQLFGSGVVKLSNGKYLEYPIYVQVDPRGDVFDDGHVVTEYSRDDRSQSSENARVARTILGNETTKGLKEFLKLYDITPGNSIQEVMLQVAELVAQKQKPQMIDNIRKVYPITFNPTFASILKGYATKMMQQQAVKPLDSTETNSVDETQSLYENDEIPLNIWWSSGENKELSNMAPRPFTFQRLNFNSVEHAFHFCKMQALREAIRFICGNTKSAKTAIAKCDDIISQLATASDTRVKQLGNTRITSKSKEVQQVIDDFFDNLNKHHFYAGIDDWNSMSSKWMKKFMLESFEQNPDAMQKLLATGNAQLTHTQALKTNLGQNEVNWSTEFPKLLMEVRQELRLKYGQNIPVQTTTANQAKEFEDFVKDNSYWDSEEFGNGEEMKHCKGD